MGPSSWRSTVLDSKRSAIPRRDGRVAEGARLESVYTARYPGFESLSLRHISEIKTLKPVYEAFADLCVITLKMPATGAVPLWLAIDAT